jgi:hypothetical protein
LVRAVVVLVVCAACEGVFDVHPLRFPGDGGLLPCTPASFDAMPQMKYAFAYREFVVPESGSFGVGIDPTGTVFAQQLDGSSRSMVFPSMKGYSYPGLSPDGSELFVAAQGPLVVESKLEGGTWSMQTTVAIDTKLEPGTPASGAHPGELRMVLNDPVAGMFVEWARAADGTWAAIANRTYGLTQLSDAPLATVTTPALTPNGLTLVFAAQDATGNTQDIYFIARSSLDVAFDAGVDPRHGKLATAVGVNGLSSPQLSADCTHLTVTNQSQQVIRYGP